jgi:prepilin-type N-terminal cleavage/methylation domain-containing protein
MKKTGFSLLELSIVLTIIALLAGGVVLGNSLLKSASMKRIITDVDLYKKSLEQFQEIYNELPGDMTNATQIWG